MNMFTHLKKLAVIAGLSLSLVQPANAIMLDIESGTNALLGIDDIDINGTLWDVDFGDGIWHQIDGDFATNNSPVYATAFALTEAQLDLGLAEIKKFLDSPAATEGGINYGNSSASINGCDNNRPCRVNTPYTVNLTGNAPQYDYKVFSVAGNRDIVLNSGVRQVRDDLGSTSNAVTYGVWSQAQVSAVPEPASYAMLLAGLGLLGLAKRRQQA